jgi:hypothetical protein
MGWIGLIWLRIGTSERLLWTRQCTFCFHKMLGSSWVAAQLTASQEGLSSMSGWVSDGLFYYDELCYSATWLRQSIALSAFYEATHWLILVDDDRATQPQLPRNVTDFKHATGFHIIRSILMKLTSD